MEGMSSIAAYRCAALNVIFANRAAVVHGVKGSDFVDSHWRHFKPPRNFIHDTDACEAMLPLSEVEEWHHCRLLVLCRVSSKYLLDELFVLSVEFEWNRGVIVRRIAML
jgi:hypothetical protein